MSEAKIIPLNVKNLKQDQEKSDSSEAKSMMMESMVDAAMNDPMIKDKVTKLFGLFAKPAFRQLLNMFGDDETRFMLYKDRGTGLVVFHKLKVKDDTSPNPKDDRDMKVTTPDGRKVILKHDGTWQEVDFEEPDSSVILELLMTEPDQDKDIFTVDENDLESIDVLAKKIMSKFGMKMEF